MTSDATIGDRVLSHRRFHRVNRASGMLVDYLSLPLGDPTPGIGSSKYGLVRLC